MNIDIIKNKLSSYVGKKKNFIYYGSRGQNEKFCGIINALYPRVFTIKCNDGSMRSFSYSDFAINNLKIY